MHGTLMDVKVIRDAVRLACRAPSLHNSQPWRLDLDGKGVHLFLDTSRVMLSTDRSAREAIISCGALLDHLRVAMAAAGWKAHVDRSPNPNNLDHLASIDFTPMKLVTEAHRRRVDAILIRRTDRLPFAAPTEWESFEPLLRLACDTDAVRLDVMSDDVREELEEMSKLTNSLRLYDSAYNSELDWWTAPFKFSEGIPYSALVSADEVKKVDFGRTFPLPRHRERRAEVPSDHSKILALSTYGDSRKDALICGEVLSAVLLECTMTGLGTCTVTHITELRTTRELVAAVIGQDAVSQVLIRVGIAPTTNDAPATPRRPLDDVLRFRS
jgi:nitroreductase